MFGIWVFTSQGAHGSLVLKCGSSMPCGSWGGPQWAQPGLDVEAAGLLLRGCLWTACVP